MSRKSDLQTRLTAIQSAITAAYENGHVKSYTTEIQGVTYRGVKELHDAERRTRNEIARLDRGSRFGGIKFTSP